MDIPYAKHYKGFWVREGEGAKYVEEKESSVARIVWVGVGWN